nr:putative CYP719 [synthetic construct]
MVNAVAEILTEKPWLLPATLLAVIAIAKFFLGKSSTMKWPIGPKTLPIIGNMHQLGGTDLQVVLANLAKTYGTIMTIWVGSWRPMIVLSDIEKAWEVLVNKSSDYSGRAMPEITEIISAKGKTISTSDSGPHWSNLRKGLQNVALSPHNIAAQSRFQESDITKMIKTLKQEAASNNGIVQPLDHLKKSTVRLISRLIFGQDFDDDEYVEAMHLAVEELIRVSGYARLAEAFYYAKYLPSHKRAVDSAWEVNRTVKRIVKPLLLVKPPTNCYLHFLTSQDYSEEVIIFAILEVYLLGVDSTSSTTAWALGFLIREPRVQEKLYQELKNFAGENGMIKVEDINKLPYLQAVLKETMRMKPIAPLAIPHKAVRETSLAGNKVEPETRVMVNIHAIHHNPEVWMDPYKFKPERFLQGEDINGGGNLKLMEQSLLPFSAGMRTCAGMELGKLQFGFSLANLVNAFQWDCAKKGMFPDMSDLLGFVLLMKTPLQAKIVPRGSPSINGY